jgi:hypothetical protein
LKPTLTTVVAVSYKCLLAQGQSRFRNQLIIGENGVSSSCVYKEHLSSLGQNLPRQALLSFQQICTGMSPSKLLAKETRNKTDIVYRSKTASRQQQHHHRAYR